MISVVIAARDDEEALALTLAALVPAAAEGLVREVVVADGGSSDGTLVVADAAGCTVAPCEGSLGQRRAAGARQARRGSWLLFLEPGVVLPLRWDEAAATFIERVERAGKAGERAALVGIAADGFSGPPPRLTAIGVTGARMAGLAHPDQPILVSRAFYEAIGGYGDPGAAADMRFLARIGGNRLVRLPIQALQTTDRPRGAGRLRRRLAFVAAALRLPGRLVDDLHG